MACVGWCRQHLSFQLPKWRDPCHGGPQGGSHRRGSRETGQAKGEGAGVAGSSPRASFSFGSGAFAAGLANLKDTG